MQHLVDRVQELESENAALREQCGKMAALLASGGVRTPNTDMILGAVLSGGDVMALAKQLAEKVAP